MRVRILARAAEHCEQCGYFCGDVEAVMEPDLIDAVVEELRADEVGPCAVCGYYCQFRSTDDNSGPVWLEVHHLTYERVGCERDDDLVALCCYCHGETTEREQYRAMVRRNLLPGLAKDASHAEVTEAVLGEKAWGF
jgi:hypothetical protein